MSGIVLFEASSPLQLVFLAGMIDSGAFEDDPRARLLLYSANNAHPEAEGFHLDHPEVIAALGSRFTRIVMLNELISPIHPSKWRTLGEPCLFARHVEAMMGGRVELLVMESLQVAPARTLAMAFRTAEIQIYADGLMVYSPTRFVLPSEILDRISTLHYPAFVEGLTPMLLREAGPRMVSYPLSVLDAGLESARAAAGPTPIAEPHALYLGQSLCDSGLMSAEREAALYAEGVADLRSAHPDCRVVFKAHPACSSSIIHSVAAAGRNDHGGAFMLMQDTLPVELYFGPQTRAVGGIFSTALFFARARLAAPVRAVGALEVLRALPLLENSNRVPLVLADVLLSGEPAPSPKRLGKLVTVVGHMMQPKNLNAMAQEAQRGLPELWTICERLPDYLGVAKWRDDKPTASFTAAETLLRRGECDAAAHAATIALLRKPDSSLSALLAVDAIARAGRPRAACAFLEAFHARQRSTRLSRARLRALRRRARTGFLGLGGVIVALQRALMRALQRLGLARAG